MADGEHVPSYTIRSVDDFLSVPEDRIDDCVEEFRFALHVAKGMHKAAAAFAESQGIAVEGRLAGLSEWIWVDDGERVVRIRQAEGMSGEKGG